MNLFKKVLLSFLDSGEYKFINAGMFVSFIAAREFLNIIGKKIIDKHPFSLSDIQLDYLDHEGEFTKNFNFSDSEDFFSYLATGSLNGNKFFSTTNTATHVSFFIATISKNIFLKYSPNYFLLFLFNIYLLSFIFSARIKTFPQKNLKQQYNWLVEVFFNLYKTIFEETKTKISSKDFNSLKKELLSNKPEIFFLLLHYYNLLENSLFPSKDLQIEEKYINQYLQRILNENTSNKTLSKTFLHHSINFIDKYKQTKNNPEISNIEVGIFNYIFPNDILIKYFFLKNDMFLLTEQILSKIYFTNDNLKILKQLQSATFIQGQKLTKQLLISLSNYQKIKNNFFKGVDDFIVTFSNSLKDSFDDIINGLDFDLEDHDIKEIVSTLASQDEIPPEKLKSIESKVSNFKLPNKLKEEIQTIEQLMNFYINYIGCSRSMLPDNFYFRLLNGEVSSYIFTQIESLFTQNKIKNNPLIKQTIKNLQEYIQISADNFLTIYLKIKNRKEKNLNLKIQGQTNYAKNDFIIINHFTSAFLSFLNDFTPKDLKIYLDSPDFLNIFKDEFYPQIQKLIKLSNKKLYENITNNIEKITGIKFGPIYKYLSKQDFFNLKENVYTLNFRLFKEFTDIFYQELKNQINEKHQLLYTEILFNVKETLLGYLLLKTYIQQNIKDSNQTLLLLESIYKTNILLISEKILPEYKYISKILFQTLQKLDKFQKIINLQLLIDDNKKFFNIFITTFGQLLFNDPKTIYTIEKKKILRIRNILESITHYNKRYLIPK